MGNSASADTQRYLDCYPGEPDDKQQTRNLEFYSNKRASKPDGDTIENIHQKWLGNYGLLEVHHGYIQWLFPIREDGLNHHAQRLQLHEAKAIESDPVLQGRIITSYELMLDFYGMKLLDRSTGAISRADNWKQRYAHLNRSFHNYLRITRILKCFGEVGLEHFKLHFCSHILKEIYESKELLNCHESCIKYWSAVLRNEADRIQLKQLIDNYEEARPTRHNRTPSTSDDEDRKKALKSSREVSSEETEEKKQSQVMEVSPVSSDTEEDKNEQTKPTTENGHSDMLISKDILRSSEGDNIQE